MRTTSQNTQTTKTVSQGESRYGTAEPQIEIRLPKGTSHRLVSAALHQLAADVELATPERERWIVQTTPAVACTSSWPTRRPTRPSGGWRCSRSWRGERGESAPRK
jgi:hypothetical protein